MQKTFLLILAILLLPISMMAKKRTDGEIRQDAIAFLNSHTTKMHKIRSMRSVVKILKKSATYQVWGYETGGFVVMTTDDRFPEVIGYSEKEIGEGGNEGFQWYLAAAENAMKEIMATGVQYMPIKPDPSKYAPQMPALLSAEWGQLEPYNNMCPYGPDLHNTVGRACTGCVATAIAQILYYHRGPLHGQGGKHSVCYPENDPNNVFTIDFDKSTYDYGNMLDSYKNVNYTQAQADAVAKLMVDCGVAFDMKYGVNYSGTYSSNAVEGLHRNFGVTSARLVERENYKLDSKGWMDLIYNEVSNRRPIYYTGIDLSDTGGGHAFVLDGYDADGLVHINWGWNGDCNGFYDISLLNPTHNANSYQFSEEQDMIIGISLNSSDDGLSETVNVANPGTLKDLIDLKNKYSYTALKVKGTINSSDLLLLRDMTGRDQNGRSTRGGINRLDLSDAKIIAGGEPYYIENGVEYTTEDDMLPTKAFYRCDRLQEIILPKNIRKIGEAPFAFCSSLRSVELEENNNQEFVNKNGVIYSKDGKDLIATFPSISGKVEIQKGVKRIHNSAFAGCTSLSNLTIPSSASEIGEEAFYYCYHLTGIRTYAIEVPSLGKDAFYGIDNSVTKLYIRHNHSDAYKNSDGWKYFFEHAGQTEEFGALIKGGTNIRNYGEENPSKFRYSTTIYGNFSFEGEPLLECNATKESAPGRYVVKVSAGTIDDEAVEYQDGVLIVRAPTGVDAVCADGEQRYKVYTLDGKFIQECSQLDNFRRGIYIVNGKKVLLKNNYNAK